MNSTQNIFRTSATLYANNNYDISRKQIYRKVIENCLFLQYPNTLTRGEIQRLIEVSDSLFFSDDEICKTLHDPKWNAVFDFTPDGEDYKYTLNTKEYAKLTSNPVRTLPDYIDDYLLLSNIEDNKKEVILRFLYQTYTTNLENIQRMFKLKKILIEEVVTDFNEEEAEVINGFLDWDNDDKNREIFNLVSYALEFCMLTNKKDASFQIDSLKNKTFYLDTNIIYWAIGINGEERKRKTRSFLNKFKQVNNQFALTHNTEEEFELSIKSYIKKLRKSEAPRVNSKVYTEYVSYDDVFRYYHLWKFQRFNASVELFEAFLRSEFKTFMADFEIQHDKDCPYDAESMDGQLDEYAHSIRGVSKDKPFESARFDAENVVWVSFRRGGKDNDIFATKYFLLSSDGGLRYWDSKYYSSEIPVVMQPSQWLSILLRYVERSNDDFRSFVSFLNLKTQNEVLTDEQLQYILAGISEVTSDLNKQRFYLECIIEDDFRKGLRSKDNAQLKEYAKEYSRSKLEEELHSVQQMQGQMSGTIEELSKQLIDEKQKRIEESEERKKVHANATREIESQRQRADTLQVSLSQTQAEQAKTKSDLQASEARNHEIKQSNDKLGLENIRLKKEILLIKIVFLSALIVLLIAFIVWFFCAKKNDPNWMGCLLTLIDSLDTDIQRHGAKIILGLIITVLGGFLVKQDYNAFKERHSIEA